MLKLICVAIVSMMIAQPQEVTYSVDLPTYQTENQVVAETEYPTNIYFSKEQKGYVDDDLVYHAPIEYREMKDGLPIRYYWVEESSIPYGPEKDDPLYDEKNAVLDAELEKLEAAWTLASKDDMTPEMEKAGFQWYTSTSLCLRVSDHTGDNSDAMDRKNREAMENQGNEEEEPEPKEKGFVTVKAFVGPEITEEVYISYSSAEEGIVTVWCFPQNDYEAVVKWTEGDYGYVSSGIKNDFTSEYVGKPEQKEVTVKDGASTVIAFTVGDYEGSTDVEAEVEIEESAEPEVEVTESPESKPIPAITVDPSTLEEQKKESKLDTWMPILQLLGGFVFMLGAIFIVWKATRK